ncbi:hypothetical protein CBR_g58136 [Chara braunii]|uniref:BED-type domain-containing protein n=1 Tax=Chara braunii TaxID=69332 RepID=A0A388MEK2_CHABU|nr:hypothetical protein CBR_g58136 [Chara braunii]|eukprot:GBG92998.1 hypothetical protein CBR_g58136 [Chara braunii]
MGWAQRRQHEPVADHVQDTFRARSPVYRYLVVGQKVDNKGVIMLRCTFCNKVFQGTQFQATRHFTQTNYCKDISDEALYEIARQTQQKFEADQTERVARYAVERGLDVPDTGGARGGEAGRRPVEGGVEGDGGHGAPDPPLGVGGGETEEGVIHVDREARGPGEEGVSEYEDEPEFHPGTRERMEDWWRRASKGSATEGSSKRKEGGSDSAPTPAGKRLRQQKMTDFYVRGGRARVATTRSSGDAHVVLRLSSSGEELGSPRGHSHEEEQPVVRLTEYRRVGCGYVLPWQRDEGMLDCQAGLKAEPVRTGMRRGMTEEEIARQVALITRNPIGASAPPSADAVFGKRACIFRSYPREDDSDEEPVPEAADDPALRIPHEIDETHDDPDSKETRANTARRAADRADREMLGGEEELWGPFGEVASTGSTYAWVTTPTPTRRESSMPPPPAPKGGGTVGSNSGGGDTTIATAVDEIASSAAAAVLEELAASMLEEEVAPTARGAATVDGQVAAAGGAAGGAAAVEVEEAVAVEEEEAPSAAAMEGGWCSHGPWRRPGFERQRGYCVQGGVMAREDVAEGVAAEAVDEALPGGAEATDVAVEGRPQAVDEAVQAGQRRDEGL